MIKLFILILSFIIFCSCAERRMIRELQTFAPIENYEDDVFLDTVKNKRALVIVAHDDDDCGMSGTIAKLTLAGWQIKSFSFESHNSSKTGKNPTEIICLGNELILNDGDYRKGLDTMSNPYLPIPYEQIDGQFYTSKIKPVLIRKINEYNPSVIFSLDNEKGGYGHPEHVYISQLVKDLFDEKKINVQRIYQGVLTNWMEQKIMDEWLDKKIKKWGFQNVSTIANEVYQIDGMPEPNVQINISEVAKTKMEYLRAYDEVVKKNIRKFIPYYEKIEPETYFTIFDREFFRVLK